MAAHLLNLYYKNFMKRGFVVIVTTLFLISCTREEQFLQEMPETTLEETNGYVSGEARVYLSEELAEILEEANNRGSLQTKSNDMNFIVENLEVYEMKRLFPYAGEFEPRTRKEGLHRWYTVKYNPEIPITKAQTSLENMCGVEIFEHVREIRINDFNDLSSSLWGLYNTSSRGYDVNVRSVWQNYTVGSEKVIISVVDNGIDLKHEDLSSNCAATELHYNAVDDNHLIVAGDHGTHVAGIIGAVGNNGKGVVGVAGGDYAKGKSGVTLMSCQIFRTNPDGTSSSGNSANAIKWGADNGAVISQNSWGYTYDADGDGQLTGDEYKKAMAAKITSSDKAAVDYFIKYAGCDNNGKQLPGSPMQGGVVIFAAGNDAIQNCAPASYEKVIAVGSIANDGSKSSFSNYGDWVDICAPGTNITSTLPNNNYGNMSGTSMACPFVSGVAGLIVSHFGGPGFTNEMLKEKLIGSANKSIIPQTYMIGGLVDAYGAFVYGNDKAPSAVTDLKPSGRGNNIDLTWSIPADEDGKAAYGFLVIYDTDNAKVEGATENNLDGVSYITFAPEANVGEKVTNSITRLDFNTEYFVKMIAYSYGRSYSSATEVMLVSTTGNNAPKITVVDEKESYTLKPSETLNITFQIVEPDGHEMSVELDQASAAETLTIMPDGSYRLSIKGKDAPEGTYVSTIVATDEYGLETKETIEYTIHENTAPVKVGDPENVFMKSKGQEVSIDMSKYISDPDGESLKFEVEVSNTKVAHVISKGNNVIITALGYGSTDVKVTGKDARGEKAEASFKVLIKDPSDPISVYPNPVVDFVNVGTLDEADTKITITSQTGKKVYDETVKASAFEPARIDMRDCAPGVYTMKVTLGGKTYMETVTKI